MNPFPTHDLTELQQKTASQLAATHNLLAINPAAPSNSDVKSDRRHFRFTLAVLLAWLLTQAWRITSAAGSIGYGTGAGGAVTQATNASTGVTLSTPAGQITTVALTTGAAAEEVFTVTNTLVAATDIVAVSTTYDGAGTPIVAVKAVAAGSFKIVITNVHSADALDAALVINFAIIKGAAA